MVRRDVWIFLRIRLSFFYYIIVQLRHGSADLQYSRAIRSCFLLITWRFVHACAHTAFRASTTAAFAGHGCFTVQSRHSQNRANALSAALQLFLLITWRSVHACAHAAFRASTTAAFAGHGCFTVQSRHSQNRANALSAALQLFLLITWRSVHACAHAAFRASTTAAFAGHD